MGLLVQVHFQNGIGIGIQQLVWPWVDDTKWYDKDTFTFIQEKTDKIREVGRTEAMEGTWYSHCSIRKDTEWSIREAGRKVGQLEKRKIKRKGPSIQDVETTTNRKDENTNDHQILRTFMSHSDCNTKLHMKVPILRPNSWISANTQTHFLVTSLTISLEITDFGRMWQIMKKN